MNNDKSLIQVPEKEFGPAPWYGWMGNLTKKNIDEDLKRFLDMEIYEIIIIPLYGLKPEYLGKEYCELFRHTCGRCREWGMKLWIYDDFNWPSGTCAGKVLQKYPEFRQRKIHFSWTDNEMKKDPKWEIVEHEGCDLASYGSEWSLCSNGYLDVLNPKAVDGFIELTHDAYKKAIGEYFGEVVLGFFTDEPVMLKDGGTNFPYTPDLFEIFKENYGYDLETNISVLVDDDHDSYKVRQDYWTLVSNLFRDNCFARIADWCEVNGMSLTGHLLFEESLAGTLQYNGDVYDSLSQMQVPGIDLLCSVVSFDHDTNYTAAFGTDKCVDVTGRIIDSISLFGGKKRNICEAFGCTEPSDTSKDYKRAADFLLHHGVNIINDNLFVDSNASFRKATGCHTFWTPWVKRYDQLSRHITTLSFLNSESRVMTNLGIYYPKTDIQVRFGSPDTIFGVAGRVVPANKEWTKTQDTIHTICHGLITSQWNHYFMFDQVIQQAEIDNGAINHSGFECRVMIMPEIHYIAPETARKLSLFAAAGGYIVCLGRIPKIISESGEVGAEAFSGERICLLNEELNVLNEKLVETISKELTRDIDITGRNLESVMATHRMTKAGEMLFITNFGKETAELKHNLDNRWRLVDSVSRETLEGECFETLQLRPNESLLLIKNENNSDTVEKTYYSEKRQRISLGEKWRISGEIKNTYSLPVEIYKGDSNVDISSLKLNVDEWHPACVEVAPIDIEPEKRHWLKSSFTLKTIPKQLLVTVDGLDDCKVYINGRLATKKVENIIWDDDNITYDIKPLVVDGDNQVIIEYTPAPDRAFMYKTPCWGACMKNILPPFVVSGDFLVSELDSNRELCLVNSTIEIGSLYDQGFPNFYGTMDFERKFTLDKFSENSLLDLGNQNDLFEVEINGQPAGTLCWAPYQIKIGHLLKRGENIVKLKLHTARGGLIRRFYMNYEKVLPPMGMLDEPMILI